MSDPAPLRQRSKVDAWLVLVLVLALCAPLAQAWMLREVAPRDALLALGVFAFTATLLGVLSLPCRYTLEADQLLIQSGVLRWRIRYADITSVRPSRALWSAPAFSLDRVRIDHGGRFALVSPVGRDVFIAELQRRVDRARGGLSPAR